MNFAAALQGVERLGVDSSALISYVNAHPAFISVLSRIIHRVEHGDLKLIASTVLRTELLTQAGRVIADPQASGTFHEILSKITFVSVDEAVADEAARLRLTYHFETPDALHLASALMAECDAFLTCDHDFFRAQGVGNASGTRTLRILYPGHLTL